MSSPVPSFVKVLYVRIVKWCKRLKLSKSSLDNEILGRGEGDFARASRISASNCFTSAASVSVAGLLVVLLLRGLVEAGVRDSCSGSVGGRVRSRGDRACEGGGGEEEDEDEEGEERGKEIPGRPGGQ